MYVQYMHARIYIQNVRSYIEGCTDDISIHDFFGDRNSADTEYKPWPLLPETATQRVSDSREFGEVTAPLQIPHANT